MLYRNMFIKYQAPEASDPQPSVSNVDPDNSDPEVPTTVSIDDFNTLKAQLESVVGKNTELLGEKKAAQQKQRDEEEARKAAELESQRKSGDLEAFEKSLTEQFTTKETKFTSEIDRLNGMILGGKKSEIINDMAGMFTSPEAAKLMLGSLINTAHGDNDTISTSFNGIDGSLVTTDSKAFKEYLRNNEAFAPFLNGVDSSGGMTNASKPAASGGQAPVTDKDKRIADINKRFNQ